MITKKELKTLEKWSDYEELEFDSIYIVPTKEKYNGYNSGIYLGNIGGVIKILDKYDCGNNYDINSNGFTNGVMLNWDFENVSGGIKFWTQGKLKYSYGGRITSITK